MAVKVIRPHRVEDDRAMDGLRREINVTMGDPPRLLDLSLAQTVVGPLKLRHTMGTAAYMPPEQCDHGSATPQSDLWSIGVTLYEAVSGMRPFREGDEGGSREEEYPRLVDDAQPLAEVLYAWPNGLRVRRKQ